MVINFLTNLVGDVYKILPMKEEEIKGAKNHLPEYVKRTIINMKGSLMTYGELKIYKEYLYIINSLEYLLSEEAGLDEYRQTILNATHVISKLRTIFKKKAEHEQKDDVWYL